MSRKFGENLTQNLGRAEIFFYFKFKFTFLAKISHLLEGKSN